MALTKAEPEAGELFASWELHVIEEQGGLQRVCPTGNVDIEMAILEQVLSPEVLRGYQKAVTRTASFKRSFIRQYARISLKPCTCEAYARLAAVDKDHY
jgi:hypothetical protein